MVNNILKPWTKTKKKRTRFFVIFYCSKLYQILAFLWFIFFPFLSSCLCSVLFVATNITQKSSITRHYFHFVYCSKPVFIFLFSVFAFTFVCCLSFRFVLSVRAILSQKFERFTSIFSCFILHRSTQLFIYFFVSSLLYVSLWRSVSYRPSH